MNDPTFIFLCCLLVKKGSRKDTEETARRYGMVWKPLVVEDRQMGHD